MLMCSRFSLLQCVFTARFSHTNLHRPSSTLLFEVMCGWVVAVAMQSLFVGGCLMQGTSTKGPTYTSAELTLIGLRRRCRAGDEATTSADLRHTQERDSPITASP